MNEPWARYVCSECGWSCLKGVGNLGWYIMEEHWRVTHAEVTE